jgi:hypothetical protein
VRPVTISALAVILTGCASAAPQQVRQGSPLILHGHPVTKTEKSIAAEKPKRKANSHTVNAAPTGVPKMEVSSPVQANNNADTVRNIILKSLEKREAMVNALATLSISEPPLCTKQLPPDTAESAGVMARAYGFHVEKEDFQREVRDAGIDRVKYMSEDQKVRESICAWAQVISALAHDMYKGAEEHKRRVVETGITR